MFQPSLVDAPGAIERRQLGDGAWLDVACGWFGPGADDLFVRLVDTVAWKAERRPMYDRIVDVPRLVRFYRPEEPWPDPALVDACTRLSHRYEPELGEPLVTCGLCYYRDGHDSVAWHGDTIGRAKVEDTVVAIVSLGSERKLALPRVSLQFRPLGVR